MASVTDRRKSATRTATRDPLETKGQRANGGTIRLNVFANARDKVPTEHDLDWPGVCREIKKMASAVAGSRPPRTKAERKAFKTQLPAFNTGILAQPYNCDDNTEVLTALPIDVDHSGDLGATLERAEALGISTLIYTSPGHPDESGTDRFRVLVPLDAPLAPGEVKHARKALAEMLGVGPGQGVERADAVSQVFFAGQIAGDDPRDCYETQGAPVSTAALVSAKLTEAWPSAKAAKSVKALDRLGIEDADERTKALLDALAEHWEAPGESSQRRQVLRALGGYLARRGWTDEQIAAVGRGLDTERPERDRIALMVECARSTRESDGGTGAGWSGLAEWNPQAAAVIESVAKDPLEPAGFVGCWDEWWRKAYAPGGWVHKSRERARKMKRPTMKSTDALAKAGTAGTEPGDDEAPEIPLILRSREDATFLLLWEGDDRGYRKVAEKNLRLRIKELGFDQAFVSLRDDKNRPRTPESLFEEYGATYLHTSHAFANPLSTYDTGGDGRVMIGYPAPSIAARFDADADEWLRALAGQHYDRLCVWIASCAQRHINRLAACLIVVGKADCGKSMLGHAVARLWGSDPVAAKMLVANFNSDLLKNPILVDEEAQLFGSGDLSTKKFRDEIQSSGRSVEAKFKERVPLIGALRLIVPCNSIADLRFTDVGGPAVIEAVADRILLVDATAREAGCKAALAKLRPEGGYVVDLDRIAAHMTWITEKTELPTERFIGSGGGVSEGAILAGHVDETIDVWESFRDWLAGTGVGGLWSARNEGLALDTGALAASLEKAGRGWDRKRVRAAAAPFKVRDLRPKLKGGDQPRLWVLDAMRLADALGLDAGELERLESRLEEGTAREHLGPLR